MSPKLGMEPIRKAQVMEAARRCIARDGIGKLTLQRIAGEAGVSKGIVSHYFENKQDVLVQTFQAMIARYDARIEAGMTADLSPQGFLELIVDATFNEQVFEEERFPPVFIHFWAECLLDPQFHAVVQAMYERYESATRGLIEAGMEAGAFRAGDAAQVTHGFIALIDGLVLQYALNLGLFDLAEARAICAAYLKVTLLET